MGGIPLCILRNSEHSYITVVYYIVNGENTLNYLLRFRYNSISVDFHLTVISPFHGHENILSQNESEQQATRWCNSYWSSWPACKTFWIAH